MWGVKKKQIELRQTPDMQCSMLQDLSIAIGIECVFVSVAIGNECAKHNKRYRPNPN